MPYLAEGFKVAITGFNKPTWAERNSATLLFASLMTRMFGVQRNRDIDNISFKNKMSSKMFHQRYTTLKPFLLEKLIDATESFENNEISDKEGVLYPILIILERLYTGNLEEDIQCSLEGFIPFVMICAKGRILKTRELAAKALSSIVSDGLKLAIINNLFNDLENVNDNNHLHGVLLQLLQLVNEISELHDIDFVKVITETRWILLAKCQIVSAVYMQILIKLTRNNPRKSCNSVCKSVLSDIEIVLKTPAVLGNSVMLRSAIHLKLHLISHVMNLPLETKCIKIKEVLFSSLEKPVTQVNNFTLNFLLCLLNNDANSILLNSWDIPQEEMVLSELYTSAMKRNVFKLITSDSENFTRIIKPHLKSSDMIASKLYAVISYFPCVAAKLNLFFKKENYVVCINMMKDRCDNNMSCAMLMCLKNYIKKNYIQNRLNCARILYEFSSPNYSAACRYVVALAIIENNYLLTNPDLVNGMMFNYFY